MPDLSDPKTVKATRESANDRDRRRRDMLAAVMGMPQGRDWIWSLLEFCGVNVTPMATNALIIAHNIGKGEVGRMILAEITAITPDLYLQMLKEQGNASRPEPEPSPGTAADPDADSYAGADAEA